MKKFVVLTLVVSLFVCFAQAAGECPSKTKDANAPKDSNAPKSTMSIVSINFAGETPSKPKEANEPNAPKAPMSVASINFADDAPKAKDPNAKDPNAPKAPMSIRLAAEPNAPAAKDGAVTVRGRLIVVKDANGIISAKVESRRTETTNIVLDAKGKELAEKMAGKPVEVTGVETTKGSEKWLTVEKYAEMQRPGPGGPKGPGAPKSPEGAK